MGHMLSTVSSSTSTDYCFSPLATCPITVLSSAVSVLEDLLVPRLHLAIGSTRARAAPGCTCPAGGLRPGPQEPHGQRVGREPPGLKGWRRLRVLSEAASRSGPGN